MRVEPSARVTGAPTGREVRTPGPGPELEALRGAYLGLLKLSLCDLLGPTTTSVRGLAQGRVASRELTGEKLSLRAEGRDWPAHGLTMTGLRRLDDLQSCVEAVVAGGVEGDLIEAGCWRGGAAILMRATLDSLGARDRTVWAADSFDGFPRSGAGPERVDAAPDTAEPYLAAFDFLAAPQEEVRASLSRLGCERGARLLPGFLEETLPGLSVDSWSLIRLDTDTYDSTLLALRCLYPRLAKGGFLIVDDYEALAECRAAVDRFRQEHEISEPLERVDWTCVRWRRETEQPVAVPTAPPPAPRTPLAAPRRERGRIPTEQELELTEQLQELRERLARTEAELSARRRELEGQLEEITASTSWRLTRPLRELSLWARGPRRSR